MSLLLIEQIARYLELPASDVDAALSDLISELKEDLATHHTASIPGLGSFEQSDGTLVFTPEDTLAMAVNNRYAALDAEMVQFNPSTIDLSPSSEEGDKGNEKDIDQDFIDSLNDDDFSGDSLFTDKQIDIPAEELVGDNSFDDDFSLSQPEAKALDYTPKTIGDAPQTDSPVEPVSMKEEDPNSPDFSDKDPIHSDMEWTPFFEELEGDDFDIDNTIDLNEDDWETEMPPSSPIAASSDSSNTNADDLYFDVDADPDDTLFAAGSASMDVEDPSFENDLSWATAPLDDVTDFFEDNPSASSAFAEDDSLSVEDEFFSPGSDSSNATPDDTMFSPESIYSEEESVEADDTIFLAPDQTVPQGFTPKESPSPRSNRDPYPKFADVEAAASPPKDRNPYSYQSQDRKRRSSAGTWIALAVIGLVVVATAVTYSMGLLPIATTDTPTMGTNTPTPVAPPAVDPTPSQATDPAAVDPSTTPATSGQNGPTTPTQSATPPPVQRIGIDRSAGGWTIIVTSEVQRAPAAQIADEFAQKFQALRFPIDILIADEFNPPRHRVGVGQFASYQEASAVLDRFKDDFPGDAWLLRIE